MGDKIIDLDLLTQYDANIKEYIAELLASKADESDLPTLQDWTV